MVKPRCHPDQKSNDCEAAFQSAVRETRRRLSARQEQVIDIHHKLEHKAGLHNLSVKEPNTDSSQGIAGMFLFSLYIIFSIKLVSYCAAIDNYYICFTAVPKVAKNLLKPPLGQEMLCFMAAFYFSAEFKDRFLFIPHKQVCLL